MIVKINLKLYFFNVNLASQRGHKSVVKLLLDKKADVNHKNMHKNTALILGKLQYLHYPNDDHFYRIASAKNHKDIIEMILKHKEAQIDMQNSQEDTALMFCKSSNSFYSPIENRLLTQGKPFVATIALVFFFFSKHHGKAKTMW